MSLEKRDGSPYWYIRFTLCGREVHQSSGTTDRRAAEALEEKLRRQIWEQRNGVDAGITWEDAVKEWLVRKGGKKSIKRDSQILDLAGEIWKGKALSEITEDEIEQYARTTAASTSVANAQRHMAMLRSFFNAMYHWKKLRLPLRVELPKVPRAERFVPKTLSKAKYAELLSVLPPHLVPLITFAAETGLRFANVAELRWEGPGPYIDVAERVVHIPGTHFKNGNDHTAPLSTRAIEAVLALPRDPSGYVFVGHGGRTIKGIRKAWASATTKIGLRGLRVHDLRHAWATWHLLGGTPARFVQELSGWSDSTMIKRYTHLEVADLRQYVK